MSSPKFEDNFSKQADVYARYRPPYPAALYEWIASIAPGHAVAWDCGTGNGQAAIGLTRHFRSIIATDPSTAQIANAPAHPQIEYRVARAEESGLADQSVDAITVALALHWFDLDQFYAEARRVLKPGGKLAVSDIVTDGPLPEVIKKSLSAWAGCVAGAVEAGEYIAMMESVGFTNISITPVFFDKETIDSAINDMKDVIELKTVSRDDVYKSVYSAKSTAYKPA